MNEDYRIEDIKRATVNGREVKVFKAFKKGAEGRFFFIGEFTAPARTPNSQLWQHVQRGE